MSAPRIVEQPWRVLGFGFRRPGFESQPYLSKLCALGKSFAVSEPCFFIWKMGIKITGALSISETELMRYSGLHTVKCRARARECSYWNQCGLRCDAFARLF